MIVVQRASPHGVFDGSYVTQDPRGTGQSTTFLTRDAVVALLMKVSATTAL
jgi:hypothetical protein